MRKIFFSSFLMLISFFVKAQGTLQFNRVITFTGEVATNPIDHNSDVWTVPVGKVWKIESLTNPGTAVITGPMGNFNFLLNGTPIINFNSGKPIITPIWLKGSDSIQFTYSGSLNTGVYYYISILEFNVNQ